MKNKKYVFSFIISNAFDFLVSIILSSIVGVIILIIYHVNVETISKDPSAYTTFMTTHNGAHFFLILIGCIVSVFAGMIAARIAKEKYILFGALSATSGVIMGIVTIFQKGPDLMSLLIPVGPILGVLGGYIYSKIPHQETKDPNGKIIKPNWNISLTYYIYANLLAFIPLLVASILVSIFSLNTWIYVIASVAISSVISYFAFKISGKNIRKYYVVNDTSAITTWTLYYLIILNSLFLFISTKSQGYFSWVDIVVILEIISGSIIVERFTKDFIIEKV